LKQKRKFCPPPNSIFLSLPDDFRDAFCVVSGAFGRPCVQKIPADITEIS